MYISKGKEKTKHGCGVFQKEATNEVHEARLTRFTYGRKQASKERKPVTSLLLHQLSHALEVESNKHSTSWVQKIFSDPIHHYFHALFVQSQRNNWIGQ